MTHPADGRLAPGVAPLGALEVRRAEPRDAIWLEALAAGAGLELQVRAVLELPQARLYVIDPERGFLNVWIVQDEMQIQDLAVASSSRRQGLGRALLEATMKEAREQGVSSASLEVRESNRVGREFYRALGFGEVGRRPRYYSDGEAALLLSRAFEGRP